ncbi:TonB-dependent receptor [Luteitalea sp.]|uniref:TonB-dependent receptor n=1 Tax=Luteitalea sp. TaxID=2004800 RepID=UPI0025C3DCB1|nr:TonB-dependent receptor [Luteitalea sp.]
MHATLRRFRVLTLVLLMLAPTAVWAQLTDASLKGLVRVTGGRVVPSSTVTVTHEATGQSRTTVTSAEGTFLLAALSPGTYVLLVEADGYQPVGQSDLRLASGATVDVTVDLPNVSLSEAVDVTASRVTVAASRDPRLSEHFDRKAVQDLPLPQRDIFLLPSLSAGAALVPGAANSTKLSSSPVVTVNGNRYRGNNYVLDGAMNSNPNNSGEPAIVPSTEAVEEIQVQTLNFAAEFGRGNGSVINVQVRGGSNTLSGRVWEFHRNDALNARNYFATVKPQQTFNQFGATVGGPLRRNRTFFFAAYEGTRNDVERPYSYQVETPELRAYVERTAPTSVAARLLRQFPAPTPVRSGTGYLDQRTLVTPEGVIPAIGRANVTIADNVRFDQYIARVDHTVSARDRLAVRVIAEQQRDEGGTSSNAATLGRALRGSRGPFEGLFGNLNVGYTSVFGRAVHDTRVAYQLTDVSRGSAAAVVPTITITGITAPFGDVFVDASRLGTLEFRDILTLDRGRHALRMGVEVRRITKSLAVGPPQAGTFAFNSVADFIADRPFRQTLTVEPTTGEPANFPRHFTQFETGAFVQDQWTISDRVSVSLGLRHDYFGTVTERDDRLSSVILGQGNTFEEQLRTAAIGRVDRLYRPERFNVSPRIGLAWDPTGAGRTSIRTGYSLAYQPHHGQSISGARALPPDAVQGVIQPSTGIGTAIRYDIPVPFNPEFGRGLNAQGGVQSRPGEPPIRTTGFVVNPDIKTQYTQSWFLNGQRRLGQVWRLELGYVGTRGVNLERIDDVNRFAGDLLDGREDRLNPNFGVLLFVTNGVSSSYHAFTSEIRREFVGGLSLSANYRWSKWLDTSSDTSTGQFQDNSEPGKGAQDASCLRCEKAPSLFDVPHRVAATVVWAPQTFANAGGLVGAALRGWQLATIFVAQSGRPFSVWNGAALAAGGDYNADGGGGAVGGGFYDRPDAPAAGTVPETFSQQDFLDGLFPASAFPRPAPGQSGTLGRNTFRGPRYVSLDLSLTRAFSIGGRRQLQVRADVFNALDTLNLLLPNADLSLSNFGKSTQAFDARTMQVGARFLF